MTVSSVTPPTTPTANPPGLLWYQFMPVVSGTPPTTNPPAAKAKNNPAKDTYQPTGKVGELQPDLGGLTRNNGIYDVRSYKGSVVDRDAALGGVTKVLGVEINLISGILAVAMGWFPAGVATMVIGGIVAGLGPTSAIAGLIMQFSAFSIWMGLTGLVIAAGLLNTHQMRHFLRLE